MDYWIDDIERVKILLSLLNNCISQYFPEYSYNKKLSIESLDSCLPKKTNQQVRFQPFIDANHQQHLDVKIFVRLKLSE